MRQSEGLRLSLKASKLPNAVLLKYAELSEEKTEKRREVATREEEKKNDPLHELAVSNAMDEAATLKKIGETWIEEGNMDNAVKCYMQALQIEIEHFKERETDEAESLFKLGCIFEKQGRFQEACELAEEALKCQEEHRVENLQIADYVELIASIYFKQGRLQEVMPLLDRVKRIREAKLDAGHWDMARVLNLIGMVQNETGHLDSALDAYESAMAIFVEYEDDLSTAKMINNIASIFRKNGRLNEAADKYSSCLEIFQRVLGERSNEAAQVLRNLGGVLADLNQPARATECWKRSQEISVALHGTENLDAAATMAAQADMQLGRGNLHASLAGHAEALAMRTRLAGSKHPDTAQSSARVGVVYEQLEQYSEAEARLSTALETMRTTLGEENLEVANVMSSLAAVHYESGTWEKALELFQRCLSVRRGILGREHLETVAVERNIADCLCRLGDWKKAVGHYETALWVQQKRLGRRSRDAEATLEAVERALGTQYTQAQEQLSLAKATIRNADQRAQVLSELEEVVSKIESKIGEYGAWREPNSVAVAVRQTPMERTSRVLLKPKVPKGVMSWELAGEAEEEGVMGHVDEVWNSIRGWTARERDSGKKDALVRLDGGGFELVRGSELESRVTWHLPEGVEPGRKVVIRGLRGKTELNGRTARLLSVAPGCRDRAMVRLEVDGVDRAEDKEVSVKFANLEFLLQNGMEPGMLVRLGKGGGAGEQYGGKDGVIVGGMEADPSCVSVRMHSGDMQYVKPSALTFLPPSHLKEGSKVMLRGLTGKRKGCNGELVAVARGCSPFPKSVLVLLQEGSTVPVSVTLDHVVYPPPRWSQVGRRVVIREGYRRGQKGKVVGPDDDDESRVLVAIPGRREHVNVGVDEVDWVLPGELVVGMRVRVTGLEGSVDLNGRTGRVEKGSECSSERVVVVLDARHGLEKHVQVPATKLQVLKDEPE